MGRLTGDSLSTGSIDERRRLEPATIGGATFSSSSLSPVNESEIVGTGDAIVDGSGEGYESSTAYKFSLSIARSSTCFSFSHLYGVCLVHLAAFFDSGRFPILLCILYYGV